ncbi:MAG: bacterial transcriptional activator domain-containing protein, partial [Firmicutes bacterium]|nr:bacterial transcriptional activator domain-containing protein [Bacillota bacterium]
MLNQLDESAGHNWITRKKGQYAWNTDIDMVLDVEEFDRLVSESEKASDPGQKLEYSLQALELYQGDFLPKLSSEPWVMPISVYYHQKYLDLAAQTLSALEENKDWKISRSVAERALAIEPYSEELYQSLMRADLAMDDRSAVLNTYEKMSELLFTAFGVMPSEESRYFYREASKEVKDHTVPITSVHE